MIVALAASCASGDARSRRADQYCRVLGDHLELRLRAHEADRVHFRAWARSSPEDRANHERDPTLHDAIATHRGASSLGPMCASKHVDACSPPDALTFLDDPDAALLRTTTWLEGMRGQGPCAIPRGSRWAGCDDVSLQAVASDQELDLVREGWNLRTEKRNDPLGRDLRASATTAWWRAVVDYGIAVMPVCAPRAAASCVRLREGLTTADPDDLAARVRAVHAAAKDGTPCPSPGGPHGAGGTVNVDEADDEDSQ